MSKILDIIARLKSGDEEALKTLYLTNKKPFFLFAARYQINKDELLDIYQDVFIAFCQNVKNGKIDHLKSDITTYMFAIGKFMIFKRLKSRTDDIPVDELAAFGIEMEDIDEIDHQSQLDELRAAIKNLGQQCQNILRLFYFEEKKISEIQLILNYSTKDVLKAQKSRCLKQLKELMHKK